MKQEDIDLLKENGWLVVCQSPFEIELEDDPTSNARGYVANFILESLKKNNKPDECLDVDTFLPEVDLDLSNLCEICKSPLKVNIVREENGCINPRCEKYYHRRQQ